MSIPPLELGTLEPRGPRLSRRMSSASHLDLSLTSVRLSPTRRRKPLRYSVANMIGSGGFAEVYLGMCHNTGELICIKQLAHGYKESDIEAMESEVALLKNLHHPNIVQVFGGGGGARRMGGWKGGRLSSGRLPLHRSCQREPEACAWQGPAAPQAPLGKWSPFSRESAAVVQR